MQHNHLFKGLTSRQILEADFGLEREGLRVTENGVLSLTHHPEVFGDKKRNPFITTDFSESQLELITPVFSNTKDAVAFLDSLYNLAALELTDEYIWPQSMPAVTPEGQEIPLAIFKESEQDAKYRTYLMEKYGGKKQLISGIHINFSLGEQLLPLLYENSDHTKSFQQFKHSLYLKLARNYIRYHWLLLYLLGSTNTVHSTFESECVESLVEITNDTYTNKDAISFRNSICGYQNKEHIKPDYSTIENYLSSINQYIEAGVIDSVRELYSQIRLRGTDLVNEGIDYVELRTMDINPFVKSGIAVSDLDFIHSFLLYCLVKEESKTENWQDEAELNSRQVALNGRNLKTVLRKDGKPVQLVQYGQEILTEMLAFNEDCELPFAKIIQEKLNILADVEKTYSAQIGKLCQEKGYIEAHMELARSYKQAAFADRFRFQPYTDLELSTQILLMESVKRGIRFDLLDRSENFIALTKDDHTEYVKQATKTSKDQYVAVLAMENKTVTKKILRKHAIQVPDGDEYADLEFAKLAIKDWTRKPVVIKPKSTNFGVGISIFPQGAGYSDLIHGLELAFKEDTNVLIEPFINGKEYRFFVIGEETVAVLHRVPANVIGDGKSTIAELIRRKNEDLLRGKGYKTPLEKIEIDENMKLFLGQEKKTIETILAAGQIQYLRENSNISTGGDSIDVTDETPARFKRIAVSAAKAVGAKICGVDMMLENIHDDDSNYSIIELNFNPAIHIHCFPYEGTERKIGKDILRLLGFVE